MFDKITIKTEQEVAIMEEAGRISAKILDEVKKEVKPGVRTKQLEEKTKQLIKFYQVEPAFLGYDGYPAVLCTSINDVIVHQIPSDYQLKEGDIISLDFGIKYKGYYSDMAQTTGVGEISLEAKRLIEVTKKSLRLAIRKVRAGIKTGDIGNVIQRYVESQGFNIVRDLCGHGIGRELHEGPQILNYGKRHTGVKLQKGMVICIEPMVSMGSAKIKKAKDGYGYVTSDGSLSAHFEHMVAVTENGSKILTRLE